MDSPPVATTAQLRAIDIVIIVLYFVVIVALSVFSSVRSRRRAAAVAAKTLPREGDDEHVNTNAAEGFFLAGRGTSWLGVGCSLLMSNIGSEHFVALGGSGSKSGLAVSMFEWMAAFFVIVVLAYVFVPFYLATRVKTIPEFLRIRFSRGSQLYIALITIITGVLIKICVILYSGQLLMRVIFGWNELVALVALVVGTCLYTLVGGLEAIILTEIVQAVTVLAGAVPLLVIALRAAGGWDAIAPKLYEEDPQRLTMLHLFQPPFSDMKWIEFPWTGLLLGLPAMELWYWCTDQVVVQRVLAARSIVHAKGGCVLTAFAKLLIPFIMVVPGLCAHVLYTSVRGDNTDAAYPTMVKLLPPGLLGVMTSAMLAALMSSLASTYNSTSTVIAYDIYQHARPRASDRELVAVGRVSIVALTALGIVWIPFVKNLDKGMYEYIQSVISYLAPPIAVVYLAGVSWRRATPKAALWTLYVGGLVGIARFAAEFIFNALGFSRDSTATFSLLGMVVYSNFLHFGAVLTLFSAAMMLLLSVVTKPVGQEKIDAVFAHRSKANDLASYSVVPAVQEPSTSDRLGEFDRDVSNDDDSDEDKSAPRVVHHRLRFLKPRKSDSRLGNDVQKFIVHLFTFLHLALFLAILWNFR